MDLFDDKIRSSDGKIYVPIQDSDDRFHSIARCMQFRQYSLDIYLSLYASVYLDI